MPLIDDEGNLFGVVNVIDALVVCLVLAVVIAGVAFVGVLGGEITQIGGDEEQTETRYATIDLGAQPNYVAAAIADGDEANVDVSGQNLTITDVYFSPTNGYTSLYSSSSNVDKGHVVVRARITGESAVNGDERTPFQFNNSPFRIGSEININTAEYKVEGTVQRFDKNGTTLQTARTTVSIESTVSETTAASIEGGDEYRFAGNTIATVTDVKTTELENSSKVAVDLEVDLVTFDRAGTQTFGGRSLETGSRLTLQMDRYDIRGEVVRRGGSKPLNETE